MGSIRQKLIHQRYRRIAGSQRGTIKKNEKGETDELNKNAQQENSTRNWKKTNPKSNTAIL